MDYPGIATALAALIGAIVGLLGWRLSSKVQWAAINRQQRLDEGAHVEEARTFEREMRVWLRQELDAAHRECEQEKTEQRTRFVIVVGYWRDRALGRIPADSTPPPEIYGGL